MQIKKRKGNLAPFDKNKISIAMKKAFDSINKTPADGEIEKMTDLIEEKLQKNFSGKHNPGVEEIQDLVELTLIDFKHIDVVKSFILYRQIHSRDRKIFESFKSYMPNIDIEQILRKIRKDFDSKRYDLESLFLKFQSFTKATTKDKEALGLLIRAAAELTSKEAPKWEYIAGRLLNLDLKLDLEENLKELNSSSFYDKIKYMENLGLYGKYILDSYTKEEIDQLETYMDKSRCELLTYSALDLLIKRYLIRTHDGKILESPQEMYMGIAMHLMLKEKDRLKWVKKSYDILSKLQITVATPTMSNARKPFHQLSSCFIDTVPDSLEGIYRSIDNFAQVSKHGGGMGLYFGKVRANGSDIRGFKGAAGGVIRWIKLANDTAVAVDQLGVRQGSVACYLDVWHKDIPEFLQLRTNNGDDRMKAHDIFPAVCYPNLFWKLAKENINANWYMFDPHEIMAKKGYCLEDFYGKEWEDRYWDCAYDPTISKRILTVKDMVRLILKSMTETGTPFTFNRDHVNEMNPNKHAGMIYSSNLCTEIMQNMSPIETISKEIKTKDGDTVVVNTTRPGDFVVCNLASLVLGNIDLDDKNKLEDIIQTAVRGLDNVIDLNYYPLPYAKITNRKYRAIGLGVSGYHHALVKDKIAFSDLEDHKKWANRVFEDINYFAIKASMQIAKEKGSYGLFEGSEWQSGKYFERRDYYSKRWLELQEDIKENGLRNAYIMAIAPTGSTSILAGTTAGVDPLMKRYFLEEKKGSIIPRVAPDLNAQSFWIYENAHEIDQLIAAEVAGIRQRHIDQGQSMNFYITTDITMRGLLNLYIRAWEVGVKSIYYVRSKSLEVEECDYCAS
ncbi:ribonucleoside-diphosphate reductase, alpha subunit [Clostridiales bacterium KA00134]|nr:ribonucleoside-diphosphate reductase, alpha subunit [Clostridiales bacterium KA00134]